MSHNWAGTLEVAIKTKEIEPFLLAVQEKVTTHADSLKQADKKVLYKTLQKCFTQKGELFHFLKQLIAEAEQLPIIKQLVLSFLPDLFKEDRAFALVKLGMYADDENWEVRETAAWSIAELIVKEYEEIIPVLICWSQEGSPNLKRAIAVGVKVASKQRSPHWINDFLEILTPIMQTDDSYVKKNMGAFAIGDGVLRTYPEPTIAWLENLADQSEQTTVLWNIASAFSSAASSRYPESMEKLLGIVSQKSADKSVQTAVICACKKQAVYYPERVEQMLRGWNHPNQQSIVAKLAKAKGNG